MKTVKIVAVAMAISFMALSCEKSDITEQESLFNDQESHDLTKIKERT